MKTRRERTGSVRGERHDRQEDEAEPLLADVPRIAHILNALHEHLRRIRHDANGEELLYVSGSIVPIRGRETTHDKDDRHPHVHFRDLRRELVLLVLEFFRRVRVPAVHLVLARRILDVHARRDVAARSRQPATSETRRELMGMRT
jgi:hypothetical protein